MWRSRCRRLRSCPWVPMRGVPPLASPHAVRHDLAIHVSGHTPIAFHTAEPGIVQNCCVGASPTDEPPPQEPYYAHIVDLFLETTFQTECGQLLDLLSMNIELKNPSLDGWTLLVHPLPHDRMVTETMVTEISRKAIENLTYGPEKLKMQKESQKNQNISQHNFPKHCKNIAIIPLVGWQKPQQALHLQPAAAVVTSRTCWCPARHPQYPCSSCFRRTTNLSQFNRQKSDRQNFDQKKTTPSSKPQSQRTRHTTQMR